jgi:hypothetical protein
MHTDLTDAAEILRTLTAGERQTVTTDIESARAAIEASAGRLTWMDAGETWARVILGTLGTAYPTL